MEWDLAGVVQNILKGGAGVGCGQLSARAGRNSVKAPVLLPQRNIAVIIPALYINRFICLMFILFSLHTASGNNPWSGSQSHPSSVWKTRPFPPPHITADSEPVHSPLYAQKNLFRTAAKSGPGFLRLLWYSVSYPMYGSHLYSYLSLNPSSYLPYNKTPYGPGIYHPHQSEF